VGLECGSEIPGKQILDLADRIIGDPCEHGAELEFRIESVELGATDQGVHGSGTFAAAVRTGKQAVLAAESDSTQRAFGGAVVDFQHAIFGVACEGTPAHNESRPRSRS